MKNAAAATARTPTAPSTTYRVGKSEPPPDGPGSGWSASHTAVSVTSDPSISISLPGW